MPSLHFEWLEGGLIREQDITPLKSSPLLVFLGEPGCLAFMAGISSIFCKFVRFQAELF